LSRERTGVCANHQRKLSKHIKYARYLSLIPFVSYQGIK
jgi:ribosomal protein S18